MKTIEALAGFIAFLVVMLLAFSTTYNVIVKAKNRKNDINDWYAKTGESEEFNNTYNFTYNEENYGKRDLRNDLITDIFAMLFAVYDTYVTMVTGNFNEDGDL